MPRPKKVTVEKIWPVIGEQIQKILNEEPIPHKDWQELFERVYAVFLHGRKYDEIFQKVKEQVEEMVKSQKRILDDKSDEALIDEYNKQYQKIQRVMCHLELPFHRYCASANSIFLIEQINEKTPTVPERGGSPYIEGNIIYELMVTAWENIVFKDIAPRLQEAIQKITSNERSGGPPQPDLMKKAKDNLVHFAPEPSLLLEPSRESVCEAT